MGEDDVPHVPPAQPHGFECGEDVTRGRAASGSTPPTSTTAASPDRTRMYAETNPSWRDSRCQAASAGTVDGSRLVPPTVQPARPTTAIANAPRPMSTRNARRLSCGDVGVITIRSGPSRLGVAAMARVNTNDLRRAVPSESGFPAVIRVKAVPVKDDDNAETEPSALRILEACVLDHEADGSGCVAIRTGKRRGHHQGHACCLPTVDVDPVAERLVDAGVGTFSCEL